MKLLLFSLVLLIASCVSRTTEELRFKLSSSLAAPVFTISLTDPTQYSFAIVGDTHVGGQDTTRLRKILTQAAAEADSFVILLGDIVDKGERNDVLAVQSAIADAGFTGKTLYVIGNHDIFYGLHRQIFQTKKGPHLRDTNHAPHFPSKKHARTTDTGRETSAI